MPTDLTAAPCGHLVDPATIVDGLCWQCRGKALRAATLQPRLAPDGRSCDHGLHQRTPPCGECVQRARAERAEAELAAIKGLGFIEIMNPSDGGRVLINVANIANVVEAKCGCWIAQMEGRPYDLAEPYDSVVARIVEASGHIGLAR